MQSGRNSSKIDPFHKPTTYEQQVYTNSEQRITFARHEYGRVGNFRIASRKGTIFQLFPFDCITL